MKLIDEDRVVAEIDRRIQFFTEESGNSDIVIALFGLKSFIATLEVKEVDLEEEIDKELDEEWYGEYISHEKFKKSAKHFFELGMQVSNKVQKGEEI